MASTAQIADSLDPAFRKIFHDAAKDLPQIREQIYNIESSSLYQEKLSAMSGLGLVPTKTEGTATTMDDRVQLFDETFTHTSYGQGFQATREALDDDLGGSLKNTPKAMSRSILATRETLAAHPFNRHVTGAYTGADGKVLCATDHLAYGAATQSNLTTAASMTHATLASMRLALRKLKDHRGIGQRTEGRKLLVPPDLEEKAGIVTGDHYKDGSMNYDKNILHNAWEIVVWNYITITTAYWVLADKSDHQLYWFDRVKPEFNRDKGVSEQVAEWYSYFRCSNGFVDWRGIQGNNGV